MALCGCGVRETPAVANIRVALNQTPVNQQQQTKEETVNVTVNALATPVIAATPAPVAPSVIELSPALNFQPEAKKQILVEEDVVVDFLPEFQADAPLEEVPNEFISSEPSFLKTVRDNLSLTSISSGLKSIANTTADQAVKAYTYIKEHPKQAAIAAGALIVAGATAKAVHEYVVPHITSYMTPAPKLTWAERNFDVTTRQLLLYATMPIAVAASGFGALKARTKAKSIIGDTGSDNED